MGWPLRAHHPARRGHGRAAQPDAVPDDPELSDAGVCGAGHAADHRRDLAMSYDWFTQVAQTALVLGLAPLLSGVTRKIRARLLRRQGPSVLQPYRDLLKLIRKEAVVAENASWLFRAAPYLILATTWVAAALVPTFASGLPAGAAPAIIVIVALRRTAG